ncbi:hypothetical protein CARUB_v100221241mg, partial [Capsella rubella]
MAKFNSQISMLFIVVALV